jgi:regulator of replication initiation timing
MDETTTLLFQLGNKIINLKAQFESTTNEMSQLRSDFHQLTKENSKLREENSKLRSELTEENKRLRTELDEVKLTCENLMIQRNEQFYQVCVEKKLGATHKKTPLGITDISTETEHIEIKHWRNFKSALGQLQSYNFEDDKILCAYFFGNIRPDLRDTVIKLYRSKGISITEIIDLPNGVEFEMVLDMTLPENIPVKKYNFEEWLDKHVKYDDNAVLHLKDLSFLYYKKHVNIHQKNKIRKQIEKWISKKFKNINSTCIQSRHNTIKFFGWRHLRLLPTPNPTPIYTNPTSIRDGGFEDLAFL